MLSLHEPYLHYFFFDAIIVDSAISAALVQTFRRGSDDEFSLTMGSVGVQHGPQTSCPARGEPSLAHVKAC